MSVSITIRDVPDDTRNELAARAARAGQSLQEYLKAVLVEQASYPNVDDLLARARTRGALAGPQVTVDDTLTALDADRR